MDAAGRGAADGQLRGGPPRPERIRPRSFQVPQEHRDTLRVALVCPYSWSVPGGVQAHIAGLARALRARELEVEILAPAWGRLDDPGVLVVGRTVPIPDNASLVRVALSPAAAIRTATLLRTGAYDLVHVHEPTIPAVSLTALAASPVPLVGTFHMYASRPRWYRPFAPLARQALQRLQVRIAVSDAARRHVRRTCPGDYRIIPNGVDVSGQPVRTQPADEPGSRILFIGRPERRKGLPVLLEAFAHLPERARLDVVGVSQDQLERTGVRLPAAVTRRIRAHGHVTDRERARLLSSSDVLCVPSLAGESFGIVLLEGMAAGVPVVASAIPGYVDVLPPSCGILVPPGDAPRLATALAGLLDDGAARARLGSAGRQEAWKYDWSRVAARILEVYREVLGLPSHPSGPSPSVSDDHVGQAPAEAER